MRSAVNDGVERSGSGLGIVGGALTISLPLEIYLRRGTIYRRLRADIELTSTATPIELILGTAQRNCSGYLSALLSASVAHLLDARSPW
jgi:hypothetical protein